MVRPPDPGTLHDLKTVEVAVGLYRLSRSSITEPYWGKNAVYRFDDPLADQAKRFGVLYCGDKLSTAFAESILHGNALFKNGAFEVSKDLLASRELVTFRRLGRGRARQIFQLADLSGDALKAVGLNNDISAGDDYRMTQKWARAIHETFPALDGIRYVSRQSNRRYCYALFERSAVTLTSACSLNERDIQALCALFNVRRV